MFGTRTSARRHARLPMIGYQVIVVVPRIPEGTRSVLELTLFLGHVERSGASKAALAHDHRPVHHGAAGASLSRTRGLSSAGVVASATSLTQRRQAALALVTHDRHYLYCRGHFLGAAAEPQAGARLLGIHDRQHRQAASQISPTQILKIALTGMISRCSTPPHSTGA